MEKFDSNQMDEGLARLLKRATDPAVPDGAEARLMAVIRATEQQSNVVTFRPHPRLQRWAVGIPLAASLALGIYLGASGALDTYFPDSISDGTTADISDSPPTTGLEDVESFAEGELT